MSARNTALAFILALGLRAPALAQSLPPPHAEIQTGWAGFVDDAMIHHAAFGGAARWYLTPRIAVGPEVAHLRGPGSDRDVMITGNLTFDLLGPRNGRPPRVAPFFTAGGGFEVHSDRFGPTTYSSYEGAFTGGGGVRVWLTDRVFGTVETRMGWEPHVRVTGGIGIALR
jgi:hypothetical protein